MTREYFCWFCHHEWEENGDDPPAENCPNCGADEHWIEEK